MADRCDGSGYLTADHDSPYRPCPGCPVCTEAALKAAREQAELEAWYQARIGTRQPEAKSGKKKANGNSQGRMF